MTAEEKKAWAILQLQLKKAEADRLSRKDDFDAAHLSRIKAFLGPWPRALEAAGLKQAPPAPAKEKKRRNKPRQIHADKA